MRNNHGRRNFVRNGIPERVAMRLPGRKTAGVFARYDIVSDGDLRDAAKRLDDAAPVRAQKTRRGTTTLRLLLRRSGTISHLNTACRECKAVRR